MPEKIFLEDEQWDILIQPQKKWFDLRFAELWQYRKLILLLVRRDFVVFYKQTVLGPLWYLLQPLLMTVVFTVIFGKLARIPTDGLPKMLFYMCSTVTWNYFSNCLNRTSNTFMNSTTMFARVYFPRLTVPIAGTIYNLMTFTIQFFLFVAFWIYFYQKGAPIQITGWILYTPVLLLQIAALGLGLGVIISALTVKYRDFQLLTDFMVRLLMYLTPVVYPLSFVPERWRWFAALNPMTPIIETFRYAFLGAGEVRVWQLGSSMILTIAILLASASLFHKISDSFLDTV